MTLDNFAELLLGAFSLFFGIWLFDYILKKAKKVSKDEFNPVKLYAVSVTFILIGIGLIFATLLTFGQ